MAERNLTKTEDIKVTPRSLDFLTRFANSWEALREILGIVRPIRKEDGTKLVSIKASITLESGAVAEGENIPYSQAKVEEVPYADIALEKWKKGTTAEAITKYGYANAVAKTDNALLVGLQNNVMSRFYSYLLTGQLRGQYTTFQMAVAMSQGLVRNAFKAMNLESSEVVGIANILDVYEYLGGAEISLQNAFGVSYLKDFMGFRTLILASDNEIPRGKVIAVPVENIDMYYVDPSSAGLAEAGLVYDVYGETPLIGFHAEGNYDNATANTYAIMGLTLFSEYINGIAVVDFGASIPDNDLAVSATIGAAVDLFGKVVGDLQENVTVADGQIKGKLKFIDDYTGFSGIPSEQVGYFLAVKATAAEGATITAQLMGGSKPAVTLDEDGIIVFQIASNSQAIKFVATASGVSETQVLNLTGLVFE